MNRYALAVPDRIYIRDLHLRTVIGVRTWERDKHQDVVINLALTTDLSAPSGSDDLADAVDYSKLTKRVIAHVEQSSYRLLERLAGSIADVVLEHFPPVKSVTVTVDKPGALRFARSVGVELTRDRA